MSSTTLTSPATGFAAIYRLQLRLLVTVGRLITLGALGALAVVLGAVLGRSTYTTGTEAALDIVGDYGLILVVIQGRLAAEGDFHAIRDLMDDRPHRIRVETDRPRELAAGLLAAGCAIGVHLDGATTVVVDTDDVAAFRRSVAPIAQHHGARLHAVAPLDDDLESVFRYLVAR